MQPLVLSVSASGTHRVSKMRRQMIRLLPGLGVEDDAHCGETVKHRSRVARDPSQPNLRQVHLIHSELHEELERCGFSIAPGLMGENITTRGVDLLALPADTHLLVGPSAVVRLTGLRNPCTQLDTLQPGLMAATLGRDGEGKVVRKAGVMAVVVAGGVVTPGDPIEVQLPQSSRVPLEPV